MTFPPDRPASGKKAIPNQNPSLAAGLVALKQEKYSDAIAHLESACGIEVSENNISKAQMGLVVAYERTGNVQRAIALAQHLANHPNSQVKAWADRTLTNLSKLYPKESREAGEIINSKEAKSSELSPSSNTGFVPLNPTAGNTSRPKVPTTPAASSGFTPLSSSPAVQGGQKNAPASPRDRIGESAAANVPPPTTTPTTGSLYPSSLLPLKPEVTSKSPAGEQPTIVQANTEITSNTFNHQVQSSTPEQPSNHSPYQPEWKQAERAKQWQPLPIKIGFHFDISQLWGVQAVTAIALIISLYWTLVVILQFTISRIADILTKLRLYYRSEEYYDDPARFAPFAAAILTIALIASSPWIMDALLRSYYGFKPMSLQTLTAKSPEAARVVQRICRERRLPLPILGILPGAVPMALTYGNHPATARIVVTQGLLDRLANDEIAAIYASELGHIVYWDFAVMSLGVLVAQIPYIIYWRVSELGENSVHAFLRLVAGTIASIFYGIYWLTRGLMLWLSRARIYYSDRIACEITGNPNGMGRALLKIAIGIAADIQQQGKTSYLLESFELLTPVGYRQAMTLGSLYAHTPLEPILAWDYLNPYRRWLSINNSHPPMGERFQIFNRYARYWKLQTELNLSGEATVKPQSAKLFLQGSPYFGILLGLGMTGLLWAIGLISSWLRIRQIPLDWMWGDRSLLYGCLLIGMSMGIFWRINSFFPDIKPSNWREEAALANLLANVAAMPVDSQPIRLQGKLIGRSGISNWLCQDLILQTATCLVKLHYFSWLGPFGNLLFNSSRPSEIAHRAISATGWFRRGATIWIDADTLRTQSGKIYQSWHPIWSTFLAVATAGWGVYIIYRGG